MTDSGPLPTGDAHSRDDDVLPPEHPAGADAAVSAGEALSNEGIGTGAVAPGGSRGPHGRDADRPPDEDS